MAWVLSRYRAGDLVEVRSKQEILASLDGRGCMDGMPFMPEMLPFCGRRMRVRAVAHKTCDTAHQTWMGRRLGTTVHLAGASCDGSGHGDCQAGCSLFWKDSWLKPVARDGSTAALGAAASGTSAPSTSASGGCTEAQLAVDTKLPPGGKRGDLRYSCQATQMYDATRHLAWWDVRQYAFDVVTGNHSAGRVLRVLLMSWARRFAAHVPLGWRFFSRLSERIHQRLSGRPAPARHGAVPYGAQTPTGRLDLKPGERVRIKAQSEIEKTLDTMGKNRGLLFDPEEMAPFCGGVFTVRRSVKQIIEEPTGRMLSMKQPCIILEGVTCKAVYAGCRLNCPRELPSFWREIWLERVPLDPTPVPAP